MNTDYSELQNDSDATPSRETGSPLPNAGEGVGVRGQTWRDVVASVSGRPSRAVFGESIEQRGILLTPQPLSRVGERGADARDLRRSHANL